MIQKQMIKTYWTYWKLSVWETSIDSKDNKHEKEA